MGHEMAMQAIDWAEEEEDGAAVGVSGLVQRHKN